MGGKMDQSAMGGKMDQSATSEKFTLILTFVYFNRSIYIKKVNLFPKVTVSEYFWIFPKNIKNKKWMLRNYFEKDRISILKILFDSPKIYIK